MKFILGISATLAVLGPVSAHSWVEELQAINNSGNYTGDYGYTRGYVARTDPGYTGDSMNYLLPPLTSGRTRIDNTDLLCHPSQRVSSDYNNTAYPRLQIAAGSHIAMKYLENGHVTLPQNQEGKPKSAGPVFVYSTTTPSDSEKIADVLKWNRDGSGGNKRGTLLTAQNFDDGRCHQINSGTISVQRQQEFPDRVAGQPTSNVEQWCETDVLIPTSQKVGDKVTLYWVWSWPTAPGADPTYPQGKDEYYTSCAEVEIVANDGTGKPTHTLQQQDPQTMAVSDFKSRTAYTSSPVYTLAGATGSASSAPMSYTSSSASPSSASTAPTSSSSVSSTQYPSSSAAYTSNHTRPPHPATSNTISISSSSNVSAAAPATVTVTDFVTLQEAQKNVHTRTEFVTSYVTASTPVVVVSETASASVSGLVGAKFRI